MTLIYLVAGEASGDALGARLMAALKARRPDVVFAGLGGERMAAAGLVSLFPIRDLAILGILEVLPNLRRVLRRLDETAADIAARRPAAVVTIDAPGFALPLAKRMRRFGVRAVHYVAPQVWAWRPGRVRQVAARVDRLLALLPFEAEFFEAAGVHVTFVGHPVLEAEPGNAERFRAAHGLAPGERPVVVMPGSRPGEVRRLLPVFAEALRLVAARAPDLRPVVPVAAPVADAVRGAVIGWPGRPILVSAEEEKRDAFAAAEAGLIKSGTSSLELAVAGVPHVVGYRVNPVSAAIGRRMIRVQYASLVNLLVDAPVVPERLQEACAPGPLAEALVGLLTDPAAVEAQRRGFGEALARLSPPSGRPSEAAAAAVLEVVEKG